MPCLFIRNVPSRMEWDSDACGKLYFEIAKAARCSISGVEVHIENTQYQLLRMNGKLDSSHGVHVFVEWFAGRTDAAKEQIAVAIQQFLDHHNLGSGLDITFRDSPAGTFYFEGKRVGQVKFDAAYFEGKRVDNS